MVNLINVNALRVGHPSFNPARHQAVKEAAHSSEVLEPKYSPAFMVVHPLFCQLHSLKPSQFDYFYPPLIAWVKERESALINSCSAYQTRLEDALRNRSDFPIFLFAPKGFVASMEYWISSLNPRIPVVMTETLAHNPIPLFEGIDAENNAPLAWKTLSDILRTLGVKVTPIMGEFYYEVHGEWEGKRILAGGCVGYVRDVLLSEGFLCEAVPGHTYPGFVYEAESLEDYTAQVVKNAESVGHKPVWVPEIY